MPKPAERKGRHRTEACDKAAGSSGGSIGELLGLRRSREKPPPTCYAISYTLSGEGGMVRTPESQARNLHSGDQAPERKLTAEWEVPNILSLISQNC